MKKILLFLLGFALLCSISYADTKISELTAATAVTSDDLIPVVDSPGGTPVTKKITIANLVSSIDPELSAIAGLTSVSNKGIYFTGSGTASTYDLSATALTLLDDSSISAMRTTLGLAINQDVQSYDADLTTWAGLTPSSFFQTLVDDTDAATARATLGAGTGSGTVNTGVSGYFSYYPFPGGTNVDDQSIVFTDLANVGIGTSLPSSKLEVSGSIEANGTMPDFLSDGDLGYDYSTQQSFKFGAGGMAQSVPGVLFTSTADKTSASSAAEDSLIATGVGSILLPADFLTVGKNLRIRLRGQIGNTGTPTIRVKAKLGSVAVVDTGAATMSAITGTNYFEAEFSLTCRSTGASGSVYGQGEFRYFTSSSAVSGIAAASTSASTVDTTAANLLDVTVQWGTSSSSNTITATNTTVEVLN